MWYHLSPISWINTEQLNMTLSEQYVKIGICLHCLFHNEKIKNVSSLHREIGHYLLFIYFFKQNIMFVLLCFLLRQVHTETVSHFVRIAVEFGRRQWQHTPVLLSGKSHGWKSLVGFSPWGHKESDTTERLHFHFSLSCTGEGNGKPLQCPCLENPRDRGAWWAAVYGVAQSWTRPKWLSSSSRSSCGIW